MNRHFDNRHLGIVGAIAALAIGLLMAGCSSAPEETPAPSPAAGAKQPTSASMGNGAPAPAARGGGATSKE